MLTKDKDFDYFHENMGQADAFVPVPPDALAHYRGKLPDNLLYIWQRLGWSSYGQGRFWLTNPADYVDVVDRWLRGSPIAQIDTWHVITRSAFGDLRVFGEQTARSFNVSSPCHGLIGLLGDLRKKEPDPDLSVDVIVISTDFERNDLVGSNGKPLFASALKKLGPLGVDEMYGFEPHPLVGGKFDVKSLCKVKLRGYMLTQADLAPIMTPYGAISTADIEALDRE